MSEVKNKTALYSNNKQALQPYLTDNMSEDLNAADNVHDTLDVIVEYVPTAVALEIVNNELRITTSDEYKLKLDIAKKMLEGDAAFDFTIPPVSPLPAQKPITRAEAEELAQQAADTWLEKRYSDDEPKRLEDLVDILLLVNNFEITDGEKKLIAEFKGSGNKAAWFSYTGANIWPSVKVLAQRPADPYFFANLSLRMSYFDRRDEEITVRNLQYGDLNNFDGITDFRHLEAVVAKQKLVPNVDAKDYIARSDGWYDDDNRGKVNPQAVWPFFAENVKYIDKGLCLYNANRANAVIYADYAVHILSYFPSLPARYYYKLWDFLLYGPKNSIAYESFLILKRNPDFQKNLQEYTKTASDEVNKRAKLWLAELKENPQPTPKRYFLSKKEDEFWNISQVFTHYITESGEIDARYPRRSVNDSMSVGECNRIIADEIKKMKAKGFKETDENGVKSALNKRNQKALEVITKDLNAGRPLITPPAPVPASKVKLNEPVLDANGQPYVCVAAEGVLTDTADVNYMKATLQYLTEYVAETKFDSTKPFIAIGMLVKNKFTLLAFKKGKYCVSFDVLCTEAYKHTELHPWLVALLQTITAANRADDPIWADEQTMLGMSLACLLGQERQYAQLFMDYFHSIQPVDNHTSYAGDLYSVSLPEETLMQLLAGFYANSVPSGDMDDDAPSRVKKLFKKEKAFMFLAYLAIECKYLLTVEKRYANSIANSVEMYFEDFHKGKDSKVLAQLFVAYLQQEADSK